MRSVALLLLLALTIPAQFEELQIEKVSTQFTSPDGMVWVKEGYLLVADVIGKKLLRFDPGEKARLTRDADGGVQGLAVDSTGRIYMCESATRQVTRMDRKGAVEVLTATYQGKKLNAPNDIVVRKDGHVYFTDPAFGSAQDHRDLDFFGIFHLTPKGEMEPVAQWKTRPNGITLSPDGKILYVTDSDRHLVAAFDLDRAGAASNERVLVKGISGVPGGIRTDVQGRLYVAARNVEVFSSAGKPVFTIQTAEPAVNCAFGQNDMESLFISTRKALYRAELHVKGSTQY